MEHSLEHYLFAEAATAAPPPWPFGFVVLPHWCTLAVFFIPFSRLLYLECNLPGDRPPGEPAITT